MLRWLISAVGFAALKGEAQAAIQRTTRRIFLYLVAMMLWVAAFGFAVAALAVWLSDKLGPIAACAIIAGAFAVVGLIIVAVLAAGDRRRAERPGSPLPNLAATAASAPIPDIGTLGTLAAVGIVGVLLGRWLFRR
jgi:hypothetical protein